MTEWTTLPILSAVAVGGALGALFRGGIHRAIPHFYSSGQRAAAVATLLANGLGAVLLALIVNEPGSGGSVWARTFWATGFCGALTTFSTFCADAISLRHSHTARHAMAYVIGSIVVSLVGLWAGTWLAGH